MTSKRARKVCGKKQRHPVESAAAGAFAGFSMTVVSRSCGEMVGTTVCLAIGDSLLWARPPFRMPPNRYGTYLWEREGKISQPVDFRRRSTPGFPAGKI